VITHFAYVKTSMGSFTIALYGEDAPETVANFIGLIKMKYYNGILFHRIAKNFLIQAGDKNTLFPNKKTEWGFGGESFYGGEIEDELNPKTPSYRGGYVKGVAAMANKGPNTNSSQFFICLDKAKSLEHKWTIFGKVTEGLEVVEKISEVQVEPSDRGNFDGIPIKPVRIYSINIKFIKSPEIK
jgi:cyclophilin family peptidyl-prolyl cis-trans isomerase